MANSILAIEHLKGSLFNEPETNILEKTIKAGITTRRKFARADNVTSVIDPYPAVTSMLSPYCVLNSSTSPKTSNVLRA
ncbi:MAG: hypothetical protein JKY33_10600 [Bacteroidia bacterium]|nr:hypothetical protein [Bacteroidia bacterium]